MLSVTLERWRQWAAEVVVLQIDADKYALAQQLLETEARVEVLSLQSDMRRRYIRIPPCSLPACV